VRIKEGRFGFGQPPFFCFFVCGGRSVFIGGFERNGWWMWWFCGGLMVKWVESVVCWWLCFGVGENRRFWEIFFGGRERQKQQLLQKTEADPYGMTSKKGNGNRKATAKTNAGVLPLRLALFAQGQNDSVGVGGLG
jgi:hypothetical protein